MKHAKLIAVIVLLCGCILGAAVAGNGRRCVGAFCRGGADRPPGIVQRGQGEVWVGRRNVPLTSRGLMRVPGSTVPIGADGRVSKAPASKTMTRDASGRWLVDGQPVPPPEADGEATGAETVGGQQWQGLGIFRVWDDGQVEELHLHADSQTRDWFAVEVAP